MDYSKMAFPKPKKAQKKKLTVSEATYTTTMQKCKFKCVLCDTESDTQLQLHHIYYRSERRDLIDEPTNCIMLCKKHHDIVHSNKHKWQPLLLELREKLE